MKILLSALEADLEYGESLVSAFRSLGHEVFLCVPDKMDAELFSHRLKRYLPFKGSIASYWRFYKRRVNQILFREAEHYKPDFFLALGGEYILAETVQRMKEVRGVPAAVWVMREQAGADVHDPLRWLDFQSYTHVFSVDELWAQSLQMFPMPKIYLPWAGNSSAYKPLGLKKDIDILFTGDMFPEYPDTVSGYGRARVLQSLFQANLPVTALAPQARKLQYFFPDLQYRIVPKQKYSAEELNRWYNRSKIVVYVNPLLLKTDFSSTVFNIAQSGSLLITDHKLNAERLFDGHMPTARTTNELINTVRHYLDHPHERERLQNSIHAVVSSRHTYSQRAKTILQTIQKSPA